MAVIHKKNLPPPHMSEQKRYTPGCNQLKVSLELRHQSFKKTISKDRENSIIEKKGGKTNKTCNTTA